MTVTVSTLPNGLTLIVDEMPEVESVAYDLIFPGGLVHDPVGKEGATLILSELCSRGAGEFDSRQLSDAFDEKGISHTESAGSDRFAFRGSVLAQNLPRALELTSVMVRTPHLPEDEVESIRLLLLQDLNSKTDNPSRWVFQELSSRYFPAPWNCSNLGTLAGLTSTTISDLRGMWERTFAPQRAILSVAGKVKAAEVHALAVRYFGTWEGAGVAVPEVAKFPPRAAHHIQHESAQLQIALAYPSAQFGHPQFYTSKVAAVILAGGMFGRLFIEVREKRGLVYTVYARHSATRDYGFVTAYAGTTPERAHETLSVMVKELKGLHGTVTEQELVRAKANVKASLIMGEESSGARAGSNASDYWLGKRIRPLEEILSGINSVTARDIDMHLEQFPVDPFMLVTLGNREIK